MTPIVALIPLILVWLVGQTSMRIASCQKGLAEVAVYHLSMKSGSRASGQSAAAHGAYIAREGKYAAQSLDDEAVLVEHGNLPDFANGDAHLFWAAADDHERANGRLWSEIEVSLPRELSKDDQIALAREFREAMIGDRHAYSLAIHVPKTLDGNADNPHIHLMFSERVIDERTRLLAEDTYFKRNGALKDRSWNDQEKVEAVRLAWETLANRALERAGFEARIDRRSLAAQGISRVAEPKMGKAARDVGRFLRAVKTKVLVPLEQLSERAQAALSVRVIRGLDTQRSAVVIELAKVREERAAKEQARAEQRQRLEGLPLDQLRRETLGLQPVSGASGRPAWEWEWAQLPDIVNADRGKKDALEAVKYAEADAKAVTRRREQVALAEQSYRKSHRIKAALHAVGFKDGKLKAFHNEHAFLEKQQANAQQQLILTKTEQHAADATWQRIAADPMLQAQAREIYGDNVARWDDAKQILVRREAERRHAEELAEQLMAAQRLGTAFDRGRVPEVVRKVLAYFDGLAPTTEEGWAERQSGLVQSLAGDARMRQMVEKALAPQKQIIDLEMQRKLGKKMGGPQR